MAKPWGRYELGFMRHEKFLALTGNAIALWWEAKSYCDERHTDGLFPQAALKTFRFHAPKSVSLLTRSCGSKPDGTLFAPLWETLDLGGTAYYRMHDYLDHNECREKVLARLAQGEENKANERERLKRWREDKKRQRTVSETAYVTPSETPDETPLKRSQQIQKQIQIQKQTALSEQQESGGVTARSKRPIYQSDRFAVFEWQLDDLCMMLGSHVDTFNLHGFFDDLSRQSRDSGLVIPGDREARWKWLQRQVEAEAKRRGLPMAGDSAVESTASMAEGVREILRKQGAL